MPPLLGNSPWLLDVGRGLVDLVLPPACLFCRESLPDSREPFCPSCRHELTHDPATTCPRCCGTIGEFTDTSEGCPSCRGDVLHFDGVFRLGVYEGKLREAILRLKQEAGEPLADGLGLLLFQKLADRLEKLAVQAVVPVPLHWLRRLTRGYNQAQVVAARLAQAANLPLRTRWLWRTRNTPAQTTLTPGERRLGPLKAFRARLPGYWKGMNVLLVDDVLTTGTTASSAARQLKAGGAGKVMVAVLAKSPT